MVRPEAEASYQDFLPDVLQPFALQGEVEVWDRSGAPCSLRLSLSWVYELSSIMLLVIAYDPCSLVEELASGR